MNRLFHFSPTGNGWLNLASDEYFLNTLGPDDFMLNFYINDNAVIIGRNQNAWRECKIDAMKKDNVQLVRRCSGGGAVYHDRGNLNFSFIAGKQHYDLERQMDIVLDAVNSCGIKAEKSGRNDITVDGKKFSGNAFCSRGGNRQHHGTLLICADLSVMKNYLNVSPDKLKSKGVKSVRSRVCNLTEYNPALTTDMMTKALCEACSRRLGDFTEYVAGQQDMAEIGKLYEKHASWQWEMGTSPQFDYTFENRFPWGEVQLCFDVTNGIVSGVQLYTDSLDTELSSVVSAAVTGARFSMEELASRLTSSPENAELSDLAAFLLRQEI